MPIPDHSSKLQTYLPSRRFKVGSPKQKSSSFYVNPYTLRLLLLSSTAEVTTIHPATQAQVLGVFKDSNFSFTSPFQNYTPFCFNWNFLFFSQSSWFLCTICTPLKSRIPLDSQPTQSHKEGQKGKGQTLPVLWYSPALSDFTSSHFLSQVDPQAPSPLPACLASISFSFSGDYTLS